jgi:predicted enzyme related to lactoylglutathione lyase
MPAASTEDCKDPGREYVLFSKGPSHGGLFQVSEECHLSPATHPSNEKKSKVSVCVTITVDSIDETFKLIEKAGGEVYK